MKKGPFKMKGMSFKGDLNGKLDFVYFCLYAILKNCVV